MTATHANLMSLSPRERQVLRLLDQGMSRKEMAEYLEISEHTVASHLESIYGKYGVKNAIQALRRARELGDL